MKILIDADGCPVTYITIELATLYKLDVLIVCDTSHIFNINSPIVKVLVCDTGKDISDFTILNNVIAGDIVVTQDYGLAAMCLAKKAFPINQNGFWYTEKNIDEVLFRRHIGREQRRRNKHGDKVKKRTKEHDPNFKQSLENLIKYLLKKAT